MLRNPSAHPFPDEGGNLLVITEWNGDRGYGKHLNTGMKFPPVTLLRREDIEVVGKAHAGRVR